MQNQQSTIKQKDNTAIYLDNAATTHPYSEVIFEANKAIQKYWYNPSSLYNKANEIKDKIEKARGFIGNYIGANGNEIYFTSGGSESNCWAIQGFVNYSVMRGKKPVVITTTIEHKSILECVCNLCAEIHFVGVNSCGKVDMLQLEGLLERVKRDNPDSEILVSIQYANNEIGVMQPIKQIADVVHKYRAYLHSDMVQAVGNIPVDVKAFDVDMISTSAHKFHGIKGCGFLYIRKGINITPLIYGSQNMGMRGGTENVVGIVAMETALRHCDISDNMIDAKFACRDHFMKKLKTLPYDIDFNNYIGYKDTLPTIISMTIRENITAEALVYMLNTANIFVSSGSACNSRSNKPSHVLNAIGLSEEDSIRTIRISFGADMTDEDIDKLVSEVNKAIKVLKV